jgi:hypothetical protein
MDKRSAILTLIMTFSISVWSQSVKRSLLNAGSCFYKQKIVVFGYEQRKDILVFKCFSYSNSLQPKDSAEFSLGKHTAAQYLEVSQDTVHDVLNFYFQLADQKNRVSLWRLDSTLKTICTAENYDANHVNSLIAFDDENYTYKNSLYMVTARDDSTGRQFYLSKFAVKAMDKPFEYDFKWQHAFERKYIQRATVISADSDIVIIYAHINEGLKKGQWILRLNAKTGSLLKGTKLNPKGDERHYLYSKALYSPADKSIDLAGSIYPNNMIDFKTQRSDFKTLSAIHQLFLIHIDSLGELTSRFEKTVPMPVTAKTGPAALPLHFKIREFNKQPNNSYSIWADLYEQQQPNVMSYYSSMELKLAPVEESFSVKTLTVYPLQKLIPDLLSTTKGNTYGRIYLNSAGDYDKFKYVNPLNPVVIGTGNDASNNPFYILKKVNILSGQKAYYEVFTGKKGAESKSLFNTVKNQSASLFMFGNSYISFISDPENTGYELKMNAL